MSKHMISPMRRVRAGVRVRAMVGVLAAALALGGAAQAADLTSIRVATEGAYAPYNFKDAAGNLVGFEVDLIADLCVRMHLKCEVVEQAWDGIIPALQAGKYDAIMAGMSITAEREKVIAFSREYASTPVLFCALKSSPFASFKSDLAAITLDQIDAQEQAAIDALQAALAGKSVGVQGSTTHENFVAQFMKGAEVKSYDTMENMILDLQAGRLDAGYTEATFLKTVMSKDPNVVLVGPAMTGGPLGRGVGVGLRQADTELKKKFNSAIDAAIADGSLSALTLKWFGVDISPKQ